MAIETFEKFDSRYTSAGVDPAQERHYAVLGTDDEFAARLAVQGDSPVVIDLYLDGTVLVWRQSIDMEPVGEEQWHGVVRYSTVRPTNESTFSFDTGGGTAHVTQSLSTIATHTNPTQWLIAPDFGGAIGATADGVEGTDIVVPLYQFSETHYLPATFVTPAYKATLFFLTGKVSSAAFKGFSAGEVLFLGASGALRGGGDWEISYRFAASPNVTGLAVGPITGISKEGWDYLWVRYLDAEDSAAKALVKVPAAAYIERVYARADLNDLGI